ncbi:MAG: hypothetical protein LBB15_02050 [Puniceicoccales bacterium]|nr:hypothetical protein [Puniceicoccales bacterium]
MKKIAAIATGLLSFGCLGAFEMPAFNLDTSIKFSTERAFRGYRRSTRAILSKAELGLPVLEKGRAYVGVDSALALESQKSPMFNENEIAPYVGASYDVTDMFTLDCGYIHRFWTNRVAIQKQLSFRGNSNELYVGVMADVLLSPSVYFAYNCEWKEIAIEGRIAYTYDLAQFGLSGIAVEFGANVGYDKTDRPGGISAEGAARIEGDKSHWFYGANADLVYSFNEHAKVRVGAEFAGNSAKKSSWQNAAEEAPKSMVWFNASVDCSF